MKNKIGIIILIIGVLHLLLGLVKFSSVFGGMLSEGWLNTAEGDTRGRALWFTFTGLVFLMFGFAIGYLEKEGLQVPRSLGWWLLASTILGATALPLSGFWALVLPSVLILIHSPKKSTT
ncbi:DUF6463 family protein [Spongiimicrobium salis]|uniref:DUF6463 family protein n=1 Tax=Spongiimicrobium salis TaxID=1667022 RepID=UPI00374CF391